MTRSIFSKRRRRRRRGKLQQAWKEGIDSGGAGAIDLDALKKEARVRRAFRTSETPDELKPLLLKAPHQPYEP